MGRGRSQQTNDIVEAVKIIADPDNPTTVRFILYKLVSTGVLESTKEYDKLVKVITAARIRGDLHDDCFLDNKRTVSDPTTWTDLSDYKQTMKSWYTRSYWKNQKCRPIILVEKGTVGDVLRNVCQELQTPLFISSGYYSRPFLCKLAQLMVEQAKPCHIGYVGDGDPSGFDVERAAKMGNESEGVKKREGLLSILIKNHYEDGGTEAWDNMTWERLAITPADLVGFEDFQLVALKRGDEDTKGDPRCDSFIKEYGYCAERNGEFFGAEVEALDQDVLQNRVREFIEGFIDQTAWENSEQLEQEDLSRLALIE